MNAGTIRPQRFLAAWALVLWATAAVAQMYSWKDEAGKIHYSDQPPPGKIQARKLTPAPVNVDTSGPRLKEAAAAKDAASPPPKADDTAEKAKACEKAKADMKAFEERPRRTAVLKNGSFQVLDAAERATEEEALRKAIDASCR